MYYCAYEYMTEDRGASSQAINICDNLRANADFETDFRRGDYFEEKYAASDGDTLLSNLCTAAKNRNMIIFTIALNADDHGETQMKNCASRVDSELYYFEATGNNLTGIFNTIADQITALRLNL
jgi:hypothetical protein